MISIIGNELYQWDINRQVQITSKKNINEVHFCNEDSESALVVNVDNNMIASIPNILLQSDKDLIVYTVISTEDFKRTVDRESFCVYSRKKPDNYIYTETDVLSYKALEDKVKQLEEKIKSLIIE